MTENRRGPKLTPEQKEALLHWLAAEYSAPLIRKWQRDREWAELTDGTISYYRDKWSEEIAAARQERRQSAISSGLALKEERVGRLTRHADELEAIKWLPDPKTGRLWNEKAWRETLDDIAKEMGHRRTGLDVDIIDKERAALLEQLRNNLSPEVYAQIAAALLAGTGTGAG